LKKVVKTFVNNTEKVYKVAINGEIIGVTGEYSFYVVGKWKEAKDLEVGDEIFSYYKNTGKVSDISVLMNNIEVYNFEVEDNHNYYVGRVGVLAHNDCNRTANDVISSEKKV
jgi:intein/homing endonuclease